MPVPEAEKTPAEILKDWANVGLSDEGTFKYVLIASICLVGYNYNYLKGTQLGLAGIGGVIVPTLSPLVTIGLARITFKEQIKKNEILGIFLGVIGLSLIHI